ncbi:hypothetical protein PHYPO_G00021930 [Pangasianodon hypophthalmus]|uniref:Uncharacterized protein n=1 Tax=Pangasianodon hypophthalmus TaxID=310915 RepID=A0A5N5MUW6_PANHP|nr:hypothetical protein PHYPO_G00021930 [Pangasianodon hypophthalmus]
MSIDPITGIKQSEFREGTKQAEMTVLHPPGQARALLSSLLSASHEIFNTKKTPKPKKALKPEVYSSDISSSNTAAVECGSLQVPSFLPASSDGHGAVVP